MLDKGKATQSENCMMMNLKLIIYLVQNNANILG